MLKKVKIAKIFINSDYQGKPFLNKKGEPYKMCSIESATGEKASMYIGQFKGAWDKKLDVVSAWKVGEEVEISLEENGKYLNFNLPTNENKLEARVEKLEAKVFGKVEFPDSPVGHPVQETVLDDGTVLPF